MSHEFKYELDKVRESLLIHREMAYRHALKHAGYLPRSIDVAVEKNREFIKTGKSK